MAEQPNPPKQARAQAVKPTAVPRPKADDDSAPDAGEPVERRTAADQVPLSRPRSLPRTGLVTLTRSQDRAPLASEGAGRAPSAWESVPPGCASRRAPCATTSPAAQDACHRRQSARPRLQEYG